MARIALAVGLAAAAFFLFGPFGPAAIQALSIGGTLSSGLSAAGLGLTAGNLIGSAVFPIHFPGQFGPRLNDLLVSGSSPGAFIPFGYGKAAFGGQIIWSPGLVEHSTTTTQGGKGGPTVTSTTYNYTADVAAAWGEGPGSIAKIWGDAKVLFDTGAAYINFKGDWNNSSLYAIGDVVKDGSKYYQAVIPTTSLPGIEPGTVPFGQLIWTNYTGTIPTNSNPKYAPPALYSGTSTQMPDPTVQAALGVNNCPAFRGLIYAVWTALPLADFGNRIPNLRAVVSFGSTGVFHAVGLKAGSLAAHGWNSTSNGAFNKSYPQTSSDFSFTPASLHWQGATGQNTQVATLNDIGTVVSNTDTGHYENWEAAITFSLTINAAGTYQLNLSHDDGAMIGFKATTEQGGTCTKTAGTVVNDAFGTKTVWSGFDYMAGNNNSGSYTTDPLTIVVAGGTYPCELKGEINWTNWEHRSRMILTFGAGLELVDISGGSGTDTTGVDYIVNDICKRSNIAASLIDVSDLVAS